MFGRWNWHVFVVEKECLAFIYYIYYVKAKHSVRSAKECQFHCSNLAWGLSKLFFWNGKRAFWNGKRTFWNGKRTFWNGKRTLWNVKRAFWNRTPQAWMQIAVRSVRPLHLLSQASAASRLPGHSRVGTLEDNRQHTLAFPENTKSAHLDNLTRIWIYEHCTLLEYQVPQFTNTALTNHCSRIADVVRGLPL